MLIGGKDVDVRERMLLRGKGCQRLQRPERRRRAMFVETSPGGNARKWMLMCAKGCQWAGKIKTP